MFNSKALPEGCRDGLAVALWAMLVQVYICKVGYTNFYIQIYTFSKHITESLLMLSCRLYDHEARCKLSGRTASDNDIRIGE